MLFVRCCNSKDNGVSYRITNGYFSILQSVYVKAFRMMSSPSNRWVQCFIKRFELDGMKLSYYVISLLAISKREHQSSRTNEFKGIDR